MSRYRSRNSFGEPGPGALQPLLQQNGAKSHSDSSITTTDPGLGNSQLTGLYLSHFLSTWNLRCYEFSAILFTTSAYPGTLVVSSIRGLLSNVSGMLFASTISRWAQRHPSRLRTLQWTILVQRISICLACIGWSFLVHENLGGISQVNGHIRAIVMAVLFLLGMLEKASAIGNKLVMERDWVPTLATPTSKPPLHVLNAGMKRIDLISKLGAPIFISAAAAALESQVALTLAVALMNLILLVPEWFSTKWVWSHCATLREQKQTIVEAVKDAEDDTAELPRMGRWERWGSGLKLYFNKDVWRPSLSIALQSYSVLSLTASMTTYLLNIHYGLSPITAARTFSSIIELSSTIIMPLAVSLLSKSGRDPLNGLALVGLWAISWQFLTIIPATMALLLLPESSSNPASSYPLLTALFFISLPLSQLGLWTYSLVEQTLVQILVPAAQRVEFSGVEIGFVSAAEISRWGATAIFSRPSQFKGVACSGVAIVAVSGTLFLSWVWKRWPTLFYLRSEDLA